MIDFSSDRIKALSHKDNKNLSQVGLKIGEEYGELAKAILPFDNADGTTHRFVDRDKIAEEIADVLLCLATLQHKTNIPDHKLNMWIERKSLRWEKLQEIPASATYPYEIHITVKEAPSVNQFRADCEEIGVKPIVLDLHTHTHGIINDVMTSSKMIGDNRTVIDEVDRITGELEDRGYKVVRQKVETVPWHPNTFTDRTDDNYFESHIPVTLDKDKVEDLYWLCKQRHPGSHVSRNSLKEYMDNTAIYMVTLRHKDDDLETFKKRVERLKTDIENAGHETSAKDIIEWAIYDNNVEHDSTWTEA